MQQGRPKQGASTQSHVCLGKKAVSLAWRPARQLLALPLWHRCVELAEG